MSTEPRVLGVDLTFIPTAEWLPMFEAWADKKAALGWARPEAVLHG